MNDLNKKNIIITGAVGLVGINLVPKLLQEGNNVFCVLNPHSQNTMQQIKFFQQLKRDFKHQLLYVKQFDLNDSFKLNELLEFSKVTDVVHLAFRKSGSYEELFDANAKLTLKIADVTNEFSKQVNRKIHFHYASTAYAYEDNPADNDYIKTKKSPEQGFVNKDNISISISYSPNLIGDCFDKKFLPQIIMDSFLRAGSFDLAGKALQCLDYLNVESFNNLLTKCLNANFEPGSIHRLPMNGEYRVNVEDLATSIRDRLIEILKVAKLDIKDNPSLGAVIQPLRIVDDAESLKLIGEYKGNRDLNDLLGELCKSYAMRMGKIRDDNGAFKSS
jgi:nucleoside-diphosphate-sugar epimerase